MAFHHTSPAFNAAVEINRAFADKFRQTLTVAEFQQLDRLLDGVYDAGVRDGTVKGRWESTAKEQAEAQRLARLQLLGDIEALINGTYGD